MSADQAESKSRPAEAEKPQDDQKPASEPKSEPKSEQGDQKAEQKKAEEAKADEAKQKRKPKIFLIGGVVLAVLAVGGFYYWFSNRNIEDTDDAYTDGRAITIAPRVSGEVVSLDVTDNQFVKQGQPLVHIDTSQYQIDKEQAEGALATEKAQYQCQQ